MFLTGPCPTLRVWVGTGYLCNLEGVSPEAFAEADIVGLKSLQGRLSDFMSC